MKLFLISQEQNKDFDTFDSAVVAAPNEETARQMNPGTGKPIENWQQPLLNWCHGPDHVIVRYIGEAANDVKQGVVCSSFNAG